MEDGIRLFCLRVFTSVPSFLSCSIFSLSSACLFPGITSKSCMSLLCLASRIRLLPQVMAVRRKPKQAQVSADRLCDND